MLFRKNPKTGTPTPKARVRPKTLVLGGALVATGAIVGGAVLAGQLDAPSTDVWVTTADVQAGSHLTAGDLTRMKMTVLKDSPIYETSTIPPIGELVASTTLPAGTVLSRNNVTDQVRVPPGKTLISFALDAAAIPPVSLQSGQDVTLVGIPTAGESATSASLKAVHASIFAASQLTAATSSGAGKEQVTVLVDLADAPLVAALAQAGRIALTLNK